jgi:hypothetical protein
MKRKTFVLALISIFIVSCSLGTEKQYTLFVPSNESYFKVTFEYPSDWKWEILGGEPNVASAIMKISDQAQKNNVSNSVTCHDEANVNVVVVLDKNPKKVLNAEKSAIEQGVSVTNFWEIQSQEEIELDGFPAIKMSMKDNPHPVDTFAQCVSKINITTVYFLITPDRLYKFTFSAPEDKQDTEFYRDYTRLIETINVMP